MAAGLTGSLFPPGQWYSELNKPIWTPPNWIFPVAWPILYLCMSYSGATLANIDSAGFCVGFMGVANSSQYLVDTSIFWIKEY